MFIAPNKTRGNYVKQSSVPFDNSTRQLMLRGKGMRYISCLIKMPIAQKAKFLRKGKKGITSCKRIKFNLVFFVVLLLDQLEYILKKLP